MWVHRHVADMRDILVYSCWGKGRFGKGDMESREILGARCDVIMGTWAVRGCRRAGNVVGCFDALMGVRHRWRDGRFVLDIYRWKSGLSKNYFTESKLHLWLESKQNSWLCVENMYSL